MIEEDNGYELVNKMTESNEDLPADIGDNQQHPVSETGDMDGVGGVENAEEVVKSSLFGATEDLIQIDPSRKGKVMHLVIYSITNLLIY